MKIVEEATMVDIDGEPLPEEVIVESNQAQSKLEAKQAEMEGLQRIQSVVEHGAKLFFADVVVRHT